MTTDPTTRSGDRATGDARPALLVIDDDDRMRDSLEQALARRGYDVTSCADGRSGLRAFEQADFDAVLCDLRMPEMDGVEVCRELGRAGCTAPIVVISAYGSVESAVAAMRLGAFDYITKPFKGDELQVVVEKALEQARLVRENHFLREELDAASEADGFVGDSPAMGTVLDLLPRYAGSTSTVLIRGESGTGKELVARAIHRLSARRERAFVCVNCAALSAGLLESELFGHEKGAFTGADRRRLGRFEIAAGGTLLLDEVSEIDPRLQAKLLRVLQERTFERVGSSRSIRADVRVLATTNRRLEREVREGTFREDLFFRLNVLPIRLPPLRERIGDLPLLIAHFLRRNRRRRGGPLRRLTPEAERLLLAYRWPGNVRELENVVERACILSDDAVIDAAAIVGIEDAGGEMPRQARGAPATGERELAGLPLREVERILITGALERHGGHQRRTAEELQIGVRTLRTKIKKWGLKPAFDDESLLASGVVESDTWSEGEA